MKQNCNKSKCRINKVDVTADTLTDRGSIALFVAEINALTFLERSPFPFVIFTEFRPPETINWSVNSAPFPSAEKMRVIRCTVAAAKKSTLGS
ncbi:MAG: hypothetical protein HQL09_06840 [Nitrospirae bacterium]|nr:hypothetical protein [Nitrospirota bacterium]